MANDLRTLARRMDKLREDLPVRVTNLTIEVVEVVLGVLVSGPGDGTPVDTSQAMSNWQVGVLRPKNSFIKAYAIGKEGSTFGTSRGNVMVAALAALKTRKTGQVIYLSNNAPYIRRLAYEGHSFQSPPGWVEGAVLTGRRFVQTARGRLLSD